MKGFKQTDDIERELVEVSALAIADVLGSVAACGYEWSEGQALLQECIGAARFVSCKAHDLYSGEDEIGMNPETFASLGVVVLRWLDTCRMMAVDDQLDPLAPRSREWWRRELERVERLAELGWRSAVNV